ncbi:MAG: DUF2793 domain-containing protein [Candidatus Eisenbacteria bacterium]|nr:DUF2793 domain-containing protein [Candidatus Eisenbacteria bacterium]
MTRRSVLPVFLAALLSLIVSSLHAEVLFGPVTVPNGQVYTGTFPMYCRCTAYFLEVTSQSSKAPTILLNGQQVLALTGETWRKAAVQVELREDAPNEIEIRVGRTQGRAGATVQVVERDVSPAPMPAREYVKDSSLPEEYHESFVLNHWASRFILRVENGDPDGSHRVTSGTVRVNGQEVLGPDQLHSGMAEADAEVELSEVELSTQHPNRVRVRVEGPAGAKIRIGIEEPAQSVTVTEVWEVPIVGVPGGCIGTRDGHVSVKLLHGRTALIIDESGAVDSVLADRGTSFWPERATGYSAHGNYIVTNAGGDSLIYRLYDWGWNRVTEWTGDPWGFGAVSDSGNTLVSVQYQGVRFSPDRRPEWYHIHDGAGTKLTTIPAGICGKIWGDYDLTSPDGMTVARFGPDMFRLYNRDGTLRYEVEKGFLFSLANGGLAAQGSSDVLTFYGSDGTIQRRVVGNPPKPPDSGAPYITPDGEYAMHLGVGVAMSRRTGPQSCWRFDAPEPGWVGAAWLSDDGRWVAGFSQAIYGAEQRQALWLVGAGGGVVWQALLEGSPGVSARTMFTEDGQYFYYTEHESPTGDRCVLMRVDTEDRGR